MQSFACHSFLFYQYGLCVHCTALLGHYYIQSSVFTLWHEIKKTGWLLNSWCKPISILNTVRQFVVTNFNFWQ